MAASAYAQDAAYVELYPGASPIVRNGSSAISSGFAELFASLEREHPGAQFDLNFRLLTRESVSFESAESGFYRLRVGVVGARRATTLYGSFATRVRNGRLLFDASGPASQVQFESAVGDVLFDADEETLAPEYYGPLTGVYLGPDGCSITVTRSTRRLFAHNACTREWRGMTRRAGLVWSLGSRVVSDSNTATLQFAAPDANAAATAVRLSSVDAPGVVRVYTRQTDFSVREARFASGATTLRGTLFVPNAQSGVRVPAYVMLHGSGPQDRNGYASYIELLSLRLVRAGVMVLAFDKRGTNESGGDWQQATFADLASDADAALRYLASQPEADPSRVGFVGSSQAGWVAAASVQAGAKPNRVILMGAAGAAVTVAEQNLYNTRVRMACAGFSRDDIELVLAQQRAFFAARRGTTDTDTLAALSRRAASRPKLRDWLFPTTPARSASPEWFDVLDPYFDPIPAWRSYRGDARFLFGAIDDSTPTSLVTARLRRLRGAKVIRVHVLPQTQHLGLETRTCARAISRMYRGFIQRFSAP